MKTVLFFSFALIALLCCQSALHADTKKIVFISHLSSHGSGQHEYAAGCQVLGQWLTKAYGDDKIDYEHHLIWPENPDEVFKDAATVVFFCSGGNGHLVNKHVKAFDKVMKRGVGLACLHYGVEVPIGPPGKGMLNWMGGYFETHWSVNPHWVAKFENFPKHPAANGLKPFESNDEWYFHMRFREGMENVTPILSALAPESTMKRKDGPHSGNKFVREAVAAGKPQHVAWVYQRGEDYGNGRGFGFTGLHYHKNFADDNFRKTVLNGIAWTAGLEIPEDGVPSPSIDEEGLKQTIVDTAKKFEKEKKKPNKKSEKKQAANKRKLPEAKFSSKVINTRTPGYRVKVEADIKGADELYLVVTDGGNGFGCDWADWLEPRLIGPKGEKKLTELKWTSTMSDWGKTQVNKNAGGGTLIVNGVPASYGIGTHANSVIAYKLPPGYETFKAIGALDEGGTRQGDAASVAFHVYTENPAPILKAQRRAQRRASGNDASRDPEDAVASLDVHPDLEASLWASEPMMLSPSAIDIDHRGRVWVCEVVNYRRHKGKRPEGDRILILEDTDADGKADKSTVFYQGNDIDSAHGICVLGNRAIVSAHEEVFSLYDDNGDGKADRKEMMFTKIGGVQHDHGIHAFMFGPDGRLYFNFGNSGKQLCDAEGNVIVDLAGNKIVTNRRPYQQGMIFRCALDGSQVESLAWNFRNNWEVAVDSYGALWQSDNDDDGNRGVRINFVMEYGNYGYRDEITGAGWRDERINMHEEIPLRHWHLRDPGVVPNLLQTGAGSPTGIMVYEGDLLPKAFQGQMIHCDAGPNVCRAYPVTNDGAGYKADTINILSSTKDRWYRPSDVAVAPDGSLIVADWYDPGVGGHGMGDLDRGRLFRVAPKGNKPTKFAKLDVSTTENAIAALKSPNNETRYLGWKALSEGKEGRRAARKLFRDQSAKPQHRARGLFLLGWHKQGGVNAALKDDDPNIRMAGLRLARQFDDKLLEAIETLIEDPDPQVRRECAIALRFQKGSKADQLWARLAAQHDGKDRWYLEALGIGADLSWESRFKALLERKNKGSGFADILWRSRAPQTSMELAKYLMSGAAAGEEKRVLRAFHFQPHGEARDQALLALFGRGAPIVAVPAAFYLSADKLQGARFYDRKVESLLKALEGQPDAVRLAAHLRLEGVEQLLLDHIVNHPADRESNTAARLLLRNEPWLAEQLVRQEGEAFQKLTRALGATGDAAAVTLLTKIAFDTTKEQALRQRLIDALALSSRGEKRLFKEAEAQTLPNDLKFTVAAILGRSRDREIRENIAKLLELPPTPGAEKFPPIPELVRLSGDPTRGAKAFEKATCATCHVVNEKGIDYGPNLTEIGDKLSIEGLYEAVLYPNNAISHGFQGVVLTKKDETQLGGYIVSETDSEVSLRMAGGVTQTVAQNEIAKREAMELSLMPPGLAAILSTEELADLVAYMRTLKK